MARLFLLLSAAVWILYGIYCLFVPGSLAQAAAVSAATPTGTTELRAMYGGLQIAIGVLALMGALRSHLTRTALIALGTLAAGLGTARLIGLWIDGGYTRYTGLGLGFEWLTVVASRWLLYRGR